MTTDELLIIVEKEIDRLFMDKEPKSLYEPMAYVMKAPGKRLRPLLVLLSCRAAGGRIEDSLPAAVAVEILHAFTLVHDDIMDHDEKRRGQPTIHKKWDEAVAILAGDGLVTRAFQVLLQSHSAVVPDLLKIFTEGLMDLCEGQAMDKEFESRTQVSLDEYIRMIRKKTARLIEVSCEMGVVLAHADAEVRGRVKEFALSLGEAFQIQDDLMDIEADEKLMGKPRGSDIVQGKKTFLTIHFNQKAGNRQSKEYKDLRKREHLAGEQIERMLELFRDTGSIAAARRRVEELIDTAVESVKRLPGAIFQGEELISLAERVKLRVN